MQTLSDLRDQTTRDALAAEFRRFATRYPDFGLIFCHGPIQDWSNLVQEFRQKAASRIGRFDVSDTYVVATRFSRLDENEPAIHDDRQEPDCQHCWYIYGSPEAWDIFSHLAERSALRLPDRLQDPYTEPLDWIMFALTDIEESGSDFAVNFWLSGAASLTSAWHFYMHPALAVACLLDAINQEERDTADRLSVDDESDEPNSTMAGQSEATCERRRTENSKSEDKTKWTEAEQRLKQLTKEKPRMFRKYMTDRELMALLDCSSATLRKIPLFHDLRARFPKKSSRPKVQRLTDTTLAVTAVQDETLEDLVASSLRDNEPSPLSVKGRSVRCRPQV